MAAAGGDRAKGDAGQGRGGGRGLERYGHAAEVVPAERRGDATQVVLEAPKLWANSAGGTEVTPLLTPPDPEERLRGAGNG